MTNAVAIFIAVCVIGFFALDHYLFELDAGVFLARKGLDLIEYLAFWR